MQLPTSFYEEMYNHNLELYISKRYSEQSGLFNRSQVNLYGAKLIELGVLTIEQHNENLKPIKQNNDRLTAGDGEE
jgi:hypothetical protein